MSDPSYEGEAGSRWTWRNIFDVVLGSAMLILAFVGIGASDVSGAGSQLYWTLLAVGFAAASFAFDWVHSNDGFAIGRGLLNVVVHWLGVFVAIQIIYFLIESGRLTNADTGLMNGVVLALGTYLCGVHADWRLLVIGAMLGLGTAAMAFLEQYVWLLVAVAILVLVASIFVARWRRRDEAY